MPQEPRLMVSALTGQVYIATKYGPHPENPSGWVATEKFEVEPKDLAAIGYLPEKHLRDALALLASAQDVGVDMDYDDERDRLRKVLSDA